MTIGNAIKFIDRGIHDAALRGRFNTALDSMEFDKILDEEKLMFSAGEFEEAFHHRLTCCREEEEADQIKEFKTWWELLTGSACGNKCSSCH